MLHHLSGAALYLLSIIAVVLFLTGALSSAFYFIDWDVLADQFLMLLLMLGLLYWTTTLLPGPVRKAGKAAGKAVWKAARGRQGTHK